MSQEINQPTRRMDFRVERLLSRGTTQNWSWVGTFSTLEKARSEATGTSWHRGYTVRIVDRVTRKLLEQWDIPKEGIPGVRTFPEPGADKFEVFRAYWLTPVEADDFHINGFPTRIDQLADLFGEEAAASIRALLEVEP